VENNELRVPLQRGLYIMRLLMQSSEKLASHRCRSCHDLCNAPGLSVSGRALLASAACDAATPKASTEKSEGRNDGYCSEMKSWVLGRRCAHSDSKIVECKPFNTPPKDASRMQGLPAGFLSLMQSNPGPADQRQHQLANRRMIALRLMQCSGRPMDRLSAGRS
jgi:hypothetical protein